MRNANALTWQIQIESTFCVTLLLFTDQLLYWIFHAGHNICHTILNRFKKEGLRFVQWTLILLYYHIYRFILLLITEAFVLLKSVFPFVFQFACVYASNLWFCLFVIFCFFRWMLNFVAVCFVFFFFGILNLRILSRVKLSCGRHFHLSRILFYIFNPNFCFSATNWKAKEKTNILIWFLIKIELLWYGGINDMNKWSSWNKNELSACNITLY